MASRIIEADEEGAVYLPPDLLDDAPPRARYRVTTRGTAIVLDRVDSAAPFWAMASPEERAADLRQWAASHADGPGLPDDALRREHLYD